MVVKKNKLSFKKEYTLLIAIALFTFGSCVKKDLQPKDYINYIENEQKGLKISKSIGEVKYSLQYKPIDYIMLKENIREQTRQRKTDLDGMQYFTLSYSLVKRDKDILKAGLNSPDEYYERVNYFSFGLQNDIILLEGTDSLKCKLFNYVRSYGLSPQADFILAFDKSKNREIHDKVLIIEDKIFGGGIIKLRVSSTDIKNIPDLI